MQIAESDEQRENAKLCIRESCEPGSNMTAESERHSQKHSSQRRPTDEGTQIDESSEQFTNRRLPISES
jgi:hypothetical protein